MRTLGCGWRQFDTKWGFFKDERAHTLELLKRMLLDDILPHEMALRRQKKLPKSAAPPQLSVRLLRSLGTDDVDALRIEAVSLFNIDSLREKAVTARARREAAGISDRVEVMQPPDPPPFDTAVVGRCLEICWPYKEAGVTKKIWASGVVRRVADGLTDKRSKRARSVLPAGALLWAWEADTDRDEPAGEEWLILLPCKWNRHVQYGWRYDACEIAPGGGLVPPGSATAARSEPVIDECPSEEEYLTGDEDT